MKREKQKKREGLGIFICKWYIERKKKDMHMYKILGI